MKYVKLIAGSLVLYFLILSGSSPLGSCTKHSIEHDTTIVHIHDTTITHVHDTTIKIDTVYDITTGLVAYYNFNGGNLHDSSGNGNDIVLNNGATLTADRFGRSNNAFQFNGSTTYMQVHNSPTLNPADGITLMAIIRVGAFNTATNCNANDVIQKGEPDPVNGLYLLRFEPPTVCSAPSIDSAHEYFTASYGDDVPQGNAAGLIDTSVIHAGTWYSVVFTYDGITSKLYLNGKLKTTSQKSASFTANSQDLFIGISNFGPFPYAFNGAIDEIRIYNRALSQSAINQLGQLTQ
ncbi:MAG: LamG domain-containing protein [Bacteroidota bacterium]|nr:LamG domain-containing protein [Bacteroidota bacterium]MDP4214877.1 LamG domain-containing protein [Bacteroidota bacterium]MDP4244739.1 LamG domain-containing protein [Bacteroidota bacterium]MDP4252401.1 LamG domain-containing protein [Bacteroidota bacterium]MDP4257958.1 LamG domain-containing protein [Bacteroidota bacterium]